MQLGMLRHFRLDKQRRLRGINAGGQPINHHVPGVLLDLCGAIVMGGERVPISDKKETLILVLQAHPVLEHAVVVTKVQRSGRTHA